MVQTLFPPMTMADFFEASRGTWLNRRAVHHHDYQDDEAADSNLVIEPFNADDPVVTKICNSLNIKTEDSSGGARFWWESNIKKGVRNDDYAAVVIDVPNNEDPRKGFLLRDVGYVETQCISSNEQFFFLKIFTAFSISPMSLNPVEIKVCFFLVATSVKKFESTIIAEAILLYLQLN